MGEAEKSKPFEAGDKGEVISDFRLQGTPVRLQKGWKGVVESIDSDGHAFISFCDGLKGEWVSPEDFKELSKLDKQTIHEEKEAPKAVDVEEDDAEDDDEEVNDDTLLVSERVMALIKGKLDKGNVPTQEDITQLLNVSDLPEDDLVSIDLSVLGIASPEALTSKLVASFETTALIKKHGLKGAAEQCVKARDALSSDVQVEEEEDEDDEEEAVDEKVEESEDVVHGTGVSKEKVEPQAKRLIQKGLVHEGGEEPARKRAR